MSKVYAVGMGPGGLDYFTKEAMDTLKKVDVIAGYTVYVDLVKDVFPDKEFYATPMTKEIERCRWAIEEAVKGKDVAMVCSGDAGIYGMAGLLFELAEQYEGVEIEVVSGVSAAISGASVLGAPISNDFCVISLSDLLTPWEKIEARLEAAAKADMAICIYNPRSKKRQEHLAKACEIIMQYKQEDTVCGWVKNIGRDNQECNIVSLDKLSDEPIDMFTTVFIGTLDTKNIDGKMVTLRGYQKHEDSYFRRND